MARTTNPPDEYDAQTFRRILGDYDKRLDSLARAVGTYKVQNYTRITTLDMGTATATQIGNFLCTLVADLQDANRLGG